MRALATNRLVLEPLVADHAGEMFAALCDPAIYEHENAPPDSVEALRAYYGKLESRRSADGSEYWLNWVVRLPGKPAMGFVQATVYAGGWADLAYVFASAHWGRGYASEAVEAMVQELATSWGVTRCEAVYKTANTRSRRLLDRLGFAGPLDAREIEPDESRRVLNLPTGRRIGLERLALAAAVVALAPLLALPPPVLAAELEAPNVVPITGQLVTSGQPPANSLGTLAKQGFEAVIYLAPSTVPDAVKDEAQIVEGQGLAFVHIPIDFANPTEAHYRRFAEAMKRFGGRKVLVHCQVNMRASSLVFLWRVLERGEKPDEAYRSVSRVWTPQGPWKAFIESQLRRGGVAFEIW